MTPWKMTRNQDLNVLHVDSAAKWADSLKALRVVRGDTLVFDFVYFLHPVSTVVPWSSVPWSDARCGGLLNAVIAASSHGSLRGDAPVISTCVFLASQYHGCLAIGLTHLEAVVSALVLVSCLPGCLQLCYAAITR